MSKHVAQLLIAGLLSTVALGQGETNVVYQRNQFYENPNAPCYPCYDIWLDPPEVIIYGSEKGREFFPGRGLRPAHVRRACAGTHGAATDV